MSRCRDYRRGAEREKDREKERERKRERVMPRAVYKVISIRIRRSHPSLSRRIDLISLISVNDFARGKRPSRDASECRQDPIEACLHTNTSS